MRGRLIHLLRRICNLRAASVAIVATVAVAVVPATAFASYSIWGTHVGPIYNMGQAHDNTYHGAIHSVDGNSVGTAYSRVYVVTSYDWSRVSEAGSCTDPGCYAIKGWLGPYPNGYAAVQNWGNASPSYFDAAVGW
jgi:hypothetical protein